MHDDDENVLTYMVGVAVLLFCLLLFLWPMTVSAKVVAIGEALGDRVTLTDEPCKSVVLVKVKPEYHAQFKAATYYVGQTRQTIPGCYLLFEGEYQTIWEDGDVFALPMSFFRHSQI